MARALLRLSLTIGAAVLLTGQAASAQTINAPRCGTGVHESQATGTVGFPQDRIFCPLLADPKEPRSFVSLLRGTFRSLDDPTGTGTTIGSVGIGDSSESDCISVCDASQGRSLLTAGQTR